MEELLFPNPYSAWEIPTAPLTGDITGVNHIVAGTNVTVQNVNGTYTISSTGGGGGGGLSSILAGTNITSVPEAPAGTITINAADQKATLVAGTNLTSCVEAPARTWTLNAADQTVTLVAGTNVTSCVEAPPRTWTINATGGGGGGGLTTILAGTNITSATEAPVGTVTINAADQKATLVAGASGFVSVAEAPARTWTVEYNPPIIGVQSGTNITNVTEVAPKIFEINAANQKATIVGGSYIDSVVEGPDRTWTISAANQGVTLVAGTNITSCVEGPPRTWTINATGGGGGGGVQQIVAGTWIDSIVEDPLTPGKFTINATQQGGGTPILTSANGDLAIQEVSANNFLFTAVNQRPTINAGTDISVNILDNVYTIGHARPTAANLFVAGTDIQIADEPANKYRITAANQKLSLFAGTNVTLDNDPINTPLNWTINSTVPAAYQVKSLTAGTGISVQNTSGNWTVATDTLKLVMRFQAGASNISGDGTSYTVPFDTVVLGTGWNAGTFEYNIPASGWYNIEFSAWLSGVTLNINKLMVKVASSNPGEEMILTLCHGYKFADANNNIFLNESKIGYFTIGATASIVIVCDGQAAGNKDVGIYSAGIYDSGSMRILRIA